MNISLSLPSYDKNLLIAILSKEEFFWTIVKREDIVKFIENLSEKTPETLGKVRTERLKSFFDMAPDKSDYAPALYVDFDSKQLYSYYPEPLFLERYAPDGWEGAYADFYEIIPESDRFFG